MRCCQGTRRAKAGSQPPYSLRFSSIFLRISSGLSLSVGPARRRRASAGMRSGVRTGWYLANSAQCAVPTARVDNDAVLAANVGALARAVPLADLKHINVQASKLCCWRRHGQIFRRSWHAVSDRRGAALSPAGPAAYRR